MRSNPLNRAAADDSRMSARQEDGGLATSERLAMPLRPPASGMIAPTEPGMLPETGPAQSRHRLVGDIVSLALYLAFSVYYFGSNQDYARAYVGSGGDPLSYIWALHWWPWSIIHGLNPLATDYVWYPGGFHLAWGDAVPGVGVLMAPVTLLGNAAVSYNVMMLLAPALAAWCGFLLFRYLTRDTVAALVGGYLFGFSSYELGQMLGHLSLVLVFPIPLAILLVLKRYNGEVTRPRFVFGLLAVLLSLFSFSMELFATTCFFGAMVWAVGFGLTARHRRALLTIACEIGLAGGLMAIAIIPWLYTLLVGKSDVPDLINSPWLYSADLLNYVIPTLATRIGGARFMTVSNSFFGNGNLSEQGAYLGLPLVLIGLAWFRESRSGRPAQILCIMLLLVVLCSLGPTLGADGIHSRIWGPWELFFHLPLIRLALPSRFSLYTALITAMIVAFWLAAARSRRGRVMRFAAGLLACVFLLPNLTIFHWSNLELADFFTPRNLAATFGPMPNLLILPAADGYGREMIWQWQSGMTFRQTGGYLGNPPAESYTWPLSHAINTGVIGSDFAQDVAAFCAGHRVSAIVAGPGTRQSLIDAFAKLPWRHTEIDGMRITFVPSLESYPYYHIAGDFGFDPGFGEWSWIGENVRISAHHQPYRLRITGAYRPAGTGSATIVVGTGSETQTYVLDSPNALVLSLPADSSISISSRDIVIPDKYYHNGDTRRLTVAVNLQPAVPN